MYIYIYIYIYMYTYINISIYLFIENPMQFKLSWDNHSNNAAIRQTSTRTKTMNP